MNKLTKVFENKKVCIPFITCGDPDLETTAEIIKQAVAHGTKVIQLSIPFSDPTAEEAEIQESNLRALKNGITTDKIFDFVKDLRKDVEISIVFTTYANVVFSYGAETFFKKCKEIDIDGLILLDLPFEEKDEFLPLCHEYDVNLISMIVPASKERMIKIAKEAEGFINVECDSNINELKSIVELVKKHTDIPCVMASSMSSIAQAKKASTVSDGIVMDHTIISLLEKYGKDSPVKIGEYIGKMNEAIQK